MNKKKLMEHIRFTGGHFKDGKFYIEKDKVINLISQLDEPEVLSQRWLDEHSNGASRSQYVWLDDLKELLVPKQEERISKTGELKPVVPQSVGEWIEGAKKDGCSLTKAYWLIFSNVKDSGGNITENWIYDNPELFARAWLDGYTVEEKKYYVLDKNGYVLLRRYKNDGVSSVKISTTLTVKNFEEQAPERLDSIQLTEQEIKDYDERFWTFAVPVKEEEE